MMLAISRLRCPSCRSAALSPNYILCTALRSNTIFGSTLILNISPRVVALRDRQARRGSRAPVPTWQPLP
ncbi:unnamed protein product [Chondrus crispus]|uniref:Uncharacterized protein n=1 Tax=Chondrus crispus TaxID=2769 RepID=R7QI66_CHOCR|nr:unnamed protein product [Chondrus crispus]CDF37448.1 unnamed protein product [Chondrus crispus]|eukprot:XP_005717267.1 unnamed protein product [Chondrus crispus]